MSFSKKIITFLGLCCLAQTAYSAHPLITDDASTQGIGGNQIELNADWLKEDATHTRIGSLTLTRGITESLDLFINVPMTFSTPSGMNDVSLGAKWKFFQADGLSMGLKPELRIPSGDQQKDLGDGESGAALLWMTQYEWGDFTWLFNLGSERHRFSDSTQAALHQENIHKVSLATLYAIDKQWTVLVDVGKRTNALKSEQSPEAIVFGVIYHPSEDVDVDIGYKKALNHAETDRQIGLRVTWRFK